MSYKSVLLISVAEIIHETVKSFDGEKNYMATGDLSNEDTKELEFVTYDNRPSRADLTAKIGDVILARMKSTNKVLLVQKVEAEYIYSTGFIILRPLKEIDSTFLLHFLQSTVFQDEKDKLCTGATQKAINNQNFTNLQIPLPPLPIQKRIAEILDAADALKRKDQALLKKYDELAQAIFIDMFGDPVKNEKGWEVKQIKTTTNLITYGLTVRPNYIEEGIPLISARELRNGFVNYKGAPKISYLDFSNLSKKCKPQKGDILFSKTGSIGLSAIVDGSQEFAITQNAARINFKIEFYETYFIYALLKQEAFISKCISLVKGNAVKDLQLGDFSEIEIICPPLELQIAFSKMILHSNELVRKSEENNLFSESLFNTLIQKAFKGELLA